MQEGDLTAEEKLLACIPIRNKNKIISEKISQNIFKLIWAPVILKYTPHSCFSD
jgi:hypothetical protein